MDAAGVRAGIIVLLCIAALAPFARTLGHALVWDDHYLVADVEALAARGGLAAVVGAPFLPEQNDPDNFYRPVVLLSLWLDGRLGGGSAVPFHLVNLLLHASNVLLAWLLLRAVLPSRAGATGGALVFAVHPLQVEAVAFVSARTDLFAAFFALLAILAWLRGRALEGRARNVRFAASAALWLAGSLSKETVILLPAVLLVLDAVLARRDRAAGLVSRNAAWIGAYAVAFLALAAARHAVLGAVFSTAGASTAIQGPLLLREPPIALTGAMRLLRLVLFPWPLNSMYTRDDLGLDVASVLSVAVLCAVCGLLAARSAAILGGSVVVFFLAPSLLVLSGSATLTAERYMYVPMVGVAILAGAVFERLAALSAAGTWRRVGAAVFAAGLCVMASASFVRAGVWRDDLTLTTEQVRRSPRAAFAHDLHGQALLRLQRWEEARASFATAVTLDPRDAGFRNDLGISLRRTGRPDLAVEQFRESLRLAPGVSGTRLNLAFACVSLRDFACVEEQRRALASLDPAAQQTLERELARVGVAGPRR